VIPCAERLTYQSITGAERFSVKEEHRRYPIPVLRRNSGSSKRLGGLSRYSEPYWSKSTALIGRQSRSKRSPPMVSAKRE